MPRSLLSIMVRRLRLVVPVGREQTQKSPCPGRSPINAVERDPWARRARSLAVLATVLPRRVRGTQLWALYD